MKRLVAIIMGSDSDLAIMKDACIILEEFKIPYEVTIVSAHRTPKRMFEYAINAKERGIEVIIAGAGGAAHLPGMVASISMLPVIGVPIKSSLEGLDSLLSIVQMPAGIPVATVAINNAKNAALLACRILSLKYKEIEERLQNYINDLEKQVIDKARRLEEKGYKEY
ncbi:MAG: 5-(carboxyamino)imidazole ribonucleotide mutase [Candidatus Nitrosocaldaceae archaeon]